MNFSQELEKKLRAVASDPMLQKCVVRAMFAECERGTDLWESLEEEAESFSKETRLLLWGAEDYNNLECNEEEDIEEPCRAGLYSEGNPNAVIYRLLDLVEENVIKALEK